MTELEALITIVHSNNQGFPLVINSLVCFQNTFASIIFVEFKCFNYANHIILVYEMCVINFIPVCKLGDFSHVGSCITKSKAYLIKSFGFLMFFMYLSIHKYLSR